MGGFKNGIGVIVKEMRVPVVPVKIKNAFNLLPYNRTWPARGTVEAIFGEEMRFDSQKAEEITLSLEKAVARLG
jgi:long-chain acyl-CoA synthetase